MDRLQWIAPLAAALLLASAGCGQKAANNSTSQTATQSASASQTAPPPASPQNAPAAQPSAATPPPNPQGSPNAAPPANSASNLQQPPPSYPPNPATPNTPAQAPPSAAPAQPPPERVLTVPAGENVSVRTIDRIDSATATAGETFRATLTSALVSHNRVAIPAGATAFLVVTQSSSAGRIKGRSELEVQLTGVEYRGRRYRVHSTVYAEEGKSRGKQSAVRTGIGAVAGALIGGLAGGGKGAAIGSAAGGGAGFGVNVFTHGQQVKIPSETILNFTLRRPLEVRR